MLSELTIAQRSPYAGRGPYHRFRATQVPLPNPQPAQGINMPATGTPAVASVVITSSASATEFFLPASTATHVPQVSQFPLTQPGPATFPFQTTSNDQLPSVDQQNEFSQRNADEKYSTSTLPSSSRLPTSEVNKRNDFSVSRPVAVDVKPPAPSHRTPFKPRSSPHNRNFDDDFSEYDYGYDHQFDHNHYSFYN